ncbi:hypothetical protein OS493_013604 [Desmophyllum pertusum]|uniref:Uncharacterized protein n=1 Tax=Desmophyllum pertusum TaxID=174260 RepID=A0A9X0A389_9CNID|nr:hypothetical protein OS493_013604 [Desmophyllum pertusum]
MHMKTGMCEDTKLYPESNRALDDMYVDLVIYTGRAEHAFTDLLKRHEIFDIYLKPQHGSIAIEKLDGLFLPNEDTEDPRKILIVGRPGIGKSLLCKKMARDWSKGDLLLDSNKSFEHLFCSNSDGSILRQRRRYLSNSY